MTSPLPEWIAKSEVDNVMDHKDLKRALAIAWEALEHATKPTGRFSMDHEQHAKNVIEDMAEDAKQALDRIRELGQPKDK